jgi:hypothetical protein
LRFCFAFFVMKWIVRPKKQRQSHFSGGKCETCHGKRWSRHDGREPTASRNLPPSYKYGTVVLLAGMGADRTDYPTVALLVATVLFVDIQYSCRRGTVQYWTRIGPINVRSGGDLNVYLPYVQGIVTALAQGDLEGEHSLGGAARICQITIF